MMAPLFYRMGVKLTGNNRLHVMIFIDLNAGAAGFRRNCGINRKDFQ
jgi:hypothetical protein